MKRGTIWRQKRRKKMVIGDMQEFRQQQLAKAEKRKKEDEKIKKGIYQMHVMVEGQCMDTFTKECEKNGTAGTKAGEGETESGAEENKKTDVRTEMERMFAAGSRNAGLRNIKIQI